MPEVGRELSNKLQMTELSWQAFIAPLLESICERLVIHKNDKVSAFDHMSEVLDGLIHCQKLAVVWTVLLLSGAELMGVQSQGLPSVADTLLQGGTNTRSVCK
jgi:hypothetical protein